MKNEQEFYAYDILEKACELRIKKNIDYKTLAKRMKVKESRIKEIFNTGHRLTLGTVFKLFKALGDNLAIITESELEKLKQKQRGKNGYKTN